MRISVALGAGRVHGSKFVTMYIRNKSRVAHAVVEVGVLDRGRPGSPCSLSLQFYVRPETLPTPPYEGDESTFRKEVLVGESPKSNDRQSDSPARVTSISGMLRHATIVGFSPNYTARRLHLLELKAVVCRQRI